MPSSAKVDVSPGSTRIYSRDFIYDGPNGTSSYQFASAGGVQQYALMGNFNLSQYRQVVVRNLITEMNSNNPRFFLIFANPIGGINLMDGIESISAGGVVVPGGDPRLHLLNLEQSMDSASAYPTSTVSTGRAAAITGAFPSFIRAEGITQVRRRKNLHDNVSLIIMAEFNSPPNHVFKNEIIIDGFH